jgi:hypothetical protein
MEKGPISDESSGRSLSATPQYIHVCTSADTNQQKLMIFIELSDNIHDWDRAPLTMEFMRSALT